MPSLWKAQIMLVRSIFFFILYILFIHVNEKTSRSGRFFHVSCLTSSHACATVLSHMPFICLLSCFARSCKRVYLRQSTFVKVDGNLPSGAKRPFFCLQKFPPYPYHPWTQSSPKSVSSGYWSWFTFLNRSLSFHLLSPLINQPRSFPNLYALHRKLTHISWINTIFS